MANARVAKKNRPQLVIMLVVFPLLSVFATYSLIWLANRESLLETTNRGDFVDPPVLARELGLRDPSGDVVDGSDSWWIWLATSNCETLCERAINEIRESGRQFKSVEHRVRYAVVAEAQSIFAAKHTYDVLNLTSDGQKSLQDGFYIVDPAGNVVLRYPLDTEPDPVLDDLARLLEVAEQE